jgi:hypothetical protein
MTLAAALVDLYADPDITVSATVGSTSARVIFRAGDDYQFGGGRLVREITMRYRAASFASLAHGNTVTIESTAYRVLEVRQLPHRDERIARLSTT